MVEPGKEVSAANSSNCSLPDEVRECWTSLVTERIFYLGTRYLCIAIEDVPLEPNPPVLDGVQVFE